MTATLQRLRSDGYDRVHLWTLRDTPQSRRFYIKCGFTETGATQDRDFGDGNPLPQVEYERLLRPHPRPECHRVAIWASAEPHRRRKRSKHGDLP